MQRLRFTQSFLPGRPFMTNPLRRRPREAPSRAVCLKIDRRRHFELALERQNREEQRLQSLLDAPNHSVIEVRSLEQLDRVVEKFDSALVLLFLYSRSCGSCKRVLAHFRRLCTEYQEANARVVFLKHDVRDDFDLVTDVTRLYDVRSVPCFLFLSGGAAIEKLQFRDSRHAMDDLASQLRRDQTHLGAAIRRVLFKIAPSAAH